MKKTPEIVLSVRKILFNPGMGELSENIFDRVLADELTLDSKFEPVSAVWHEGGEDPHRSPIFYLIAPAIQALVMVHGWQVIPWWVDRRTKDNRIHPNFEQEVLAALFMAGSFNCLTAVFTGQSDDFLSLVRKYDISLLSLMSQVVFEKTEDYEGVVLSTNLKRGIGLFLAGKDGEYQEVYQQRERSLKSFFREKRVELLAVNGDDSFWQIEMFGTIAKCYFNNLSSLERVSTLQEIYSREP